MSLRVSQNCFGAAQAPRLSRSARRGVVSVRAEHGTEASRRSLIMGTAGLAGVSLIPQGRFVFFDLFSLQFRMPA